MNRAIMQKRTAQGKFKTRAEENGDMFISGYFAVFGKDYEIFDGAIETVSNTAFDGALNDDIRCLINHESMYVLGRTTSGTLTLRVDGVGLFGEVKINPNDQDAVNLYERVKRGDVNQCSFGFDILEESYEDFGEFVKWTITKVKLYEVSIVTFPAYEDTSVTARSKQLKDIKIRGLDTYKNNILKKLKGEK